MKKRLTLDLVRISGALRIPRKHYPHLDVPYIPRKTDIDLSEMLYEIRQYANQIYKKAMSDEKRKTSQLERS